MAGIYVVNESETLTINDDRSLIDSDIKFGNFELRNIKLEKTNNILDDEFSKIMNNYEIINQLSIKKC